MAKSGLQPVRIQFKTNRIIKRSRTATIKAYDKITRQMEAELRRKITRGQSPPTSRPGAHPHKDSGFLSKNFQVLRKGFKIFLRIPKYGEYLETGTRKMAARPWIHRNIGTPDKRRTWTRRINAEIRRNVTGP